jgi:hypothetical protein
MNSLAWRKAVTRLTLKETVVLLRDMILLVERLEMPGSTQREQNLGLSYNACLLKRPVYRERLIEVGP